ncbi:MAG: hypothetical protein ACI3W7_09115 [Oscillospiraceae bacterium]
MRCKKNGNFLGIAAVAAGILILLALILPTWFWWLVCAFAFLAGGILLLRK